MIHVGIDDTDMLDTPGTNKLAQHCVRECADLFTARMITRHQLLEDPRVPCTRKNGCAAIQFEHGSPGALDPLIHRIREIMLGWCPSGSDPGLCVALAPIGGEVQEFGIRCQQQLLTQDAARELAARHSIYLEG